MVLRQRPNLNCNTSADHPAVSLPYGDGGVSPYMNRQGQAKQNYSNLTPTIIRNQHSYFNDAKFDPSPKSNNKLNTFNTICVAVMVFAGIFMISSTHNISSRKDGLAAMQEEYRKISDYVKDTENELSLNQDRVLELDRKVRMLEKRNSSLKAELSETEKRSNMSKEQVSQLVQGEIQTVLKKRENAMTERINLLQNEIQEISEREALERFGKGPYNFQINVQFDSDDISSFIIETFPLDEMPHSIHYFLQTVHHQLWDGTIFLHTNDHVLQAAPTEYHGANLRDRFEKAHLKHLAFPEYNRKYKHEKYTLGFGGRPGGPDFYISTQDNSHYHGPGGQGQHDIHEDADPCFAKVIAGFDVVDRMQGISVGAIEASGGRVTRDDQVKRTTITSIILLEK